jgi:hypothetical protein
MQFHCYLGYAPFGSSTDDRIAPAIDKVAPGSPFSALNPALATP